jgi:hypothetical protein
MATFFVRSGASGTGTGATWLNAFTTLVSGANNCAAGDTVFISDDHTETSSVTGSTVVTFPGTPALPNLLLCADHTITNPGAANLKTTALLTLNGASSAWSLRGCYYAYGLHFASVLALQQCTSITTHQVYDTCLFETTTTGAGSITPSYAIGTTTEWKNCSIKVASTSSGVGGNSQGCTFRWTNTATPFAAGSTIPAGIVTLASSPPATFIEGVDFSAKSSSSLIGSIGGSFVIINGCRLGTNTTFVTPSAPSARIIVINCDSGATNNRYEQYAYQGTETTELTVVRTGGANDTVTTTSRKVVTTANCSNPLAYRTLPLTQWNTSTGTLVSGIVHGCCSSGALPTNDDIFMELSTLTNASYPLAAFSSTAMATVISTPAALAGDLTSAWDSVATQVARGTPYTSGSLPVKDSANPGRIFFCTVGGTTSTGAVSYSGIADGQTINDGGATFRACMRWRLTLVPLPQMVGTMQAHLFFTNPSATYWFDPVISSS